MARRRSGSGRVLDMKQWSAILANDQAISTAGTFKGNFLQFAEPSTILRCRGYVQAALDASKQVADTMSIAFALGIVSSDAAAAGGGSLPDPFGEPEYPWLWWGSMTLRSDIAAGEEAYGSSVQILEVDTKAMRRMKPGQSLIWVAESATVSGAPVTNVTFGFTRVLIGT